jgi:thymidine kinase
LNLLAVAHNYQVQGKAVMLMKPALDVRFGADAITSRAGLTKEADVLIHADTNLFELPRTHNHLKVDDVSCVLVDEAQFLAPKHIDQLRAITALWNVPVICYGLRTDFRTNLFPGSRRLMEVADSIEEVKVPQLCSLLVRVNKLVSYLYACLQTTCQICNRKAVFNLKHVNGKADISGPVIQLGAEEKYYPACFNCYRDSLRAAGQYVSDWEEGLSKESLSSDADESIISTSTEDVSTDVDVDSSR